MLEHAPLAAHVQFIVGPANDLHVEHTAHVQHTSARLCIAPVYAGDQNHDAQRGDLDGLVNLSAHSASLIANRLSPLAPFKFY